MVGIISTARGFFGFGCEYTDVVSAMSLLTDQIDPIQNDEFYETIRESKLTNRSAEKNSGVLTRNQYESILLSMADKNYDIRIGTFGTGTLQSALSDLGYEMEAYRNQYTGEEFRIDGTLDLKRVKLDYDEWGVVHLQFTNDNKPTSDSKFKCFTRVDSVKATVEYCAKEWHVKEEFPSNANNTVVDMMFFAFANKHFHLSHGIVPGGLVAEYLSKYAYARPLPATPAEQIAIANANIKLKKEERKLKISERKSKKVDRKLTIIDSLKTIITANVRCGDEIKAMDLSSQDDSSEEELRWINANSLNTIAETNKRVVRALVLLIQDDSSDDESVATEDGAFFHTATGVFVAFFFSNASFYPSIRRKRRL